jgi:hypothetical protein
MSIGSLGVVPQQSLIVAGGPPPLPSLPGDANITHWFKADRDLFSDAGTTPVVADDPVYQWGNQGSETTDHAIQATEANRPVYRTGGLNGQAYLDCGADTDQLFFSDLNPSHNGGITSLPLHRTFAFVIDAYDNTRTNNPLLDGTGGTNGKFLWHLRPSAGNVRFFKSQVALGVLEEPMIIVTSVASTTSFRCMINGTYSTQSQSSNASSADPTSMQFLRSTGLGEYFDGHIYEAILWGGGQVLSEANMTTVSDTLNAVYGIY